MKTYFPRGYTETIYIDVDGAQIHIKQDKFDEDMLMVTVNNGWVSCDYIRVGCGSIECFHKSIVIAVFYINSEKTKEVNP